MSLQERNEKLDSMLDKWKEALEENEAVIEEVKRSMNKRAKGYNEIN